MCESVSVFVSVFTSQVLVWMAVYVLLWIRARQTGKASDGNSGLAASHDLEDANNGAAAELDTSELKDAVTL